MNRFKPYIKYDSERDPEFPLQIKEAPGCELMDRCIQCGTCSGTCPLSVYMDLTPRRVIHLTRSGFKDDVLQSFTIWLCASCYSCSVECPKEIGITDVMYALKQRAIKDEVYPKRFPIPILSKEFLKMILSKGRITESYLMAFFLVKTNAMKLLGMSGLGMKLIKTGRLNFVPDRMKHPEKLAKLLNDTRRKGEAAQ